MNTPSSLVSDKVTDLFFGVVFDGVVFELRVLRRDPLVTSASATIISSFCELFAGVGNDPKLIFPSLAFFPLPPDFPFLSKVTFEGDPEDNPLRVILPPLPADVPSFVLSYLTFAGDGPWLLAGKSKSEGTSVEIGSNVKRVCFLRRSFRAIFEEPILL